MKSIDGHVIEVCGGFSCSPPSRHKHWFVLLNRQRLGTTFTTRKRAMEFALNLRLCLKGKQ